MRAVILFFLCVALTTTCSALRAEYTFEQYVRDFHKTYTGEEYVLRKSLFEKSLKEIASHDASSTGYKKGINAFSDWSESEKQRVNGWRSSKQFRQKLSLHKMSGMKAPAALDYRLRAPAVLSSVKNQGHCGSCWAFSATEAIESHCAIQTGMLYDLSPQQITSCTPNPRHCGGNGGCEGAVESLAFEYLTNSSGLAEEWTYPYTSFNGDSGKCLTPVQPAVKLNGYVALPPNDEDAMVDALVSKGPLTVSVDASKWHSYSGGIFTGCDYHHNITTNHAVQLVGYGFDHGEKKKYWIIRNSWGPRWGENGYMRLLRDDFKKCGWNVDTHSGSACDGDPDEEWVCGMCGVLSSSSYPIIQV